MRCCSEGVGTWPGLSPGPVLHKRLPHSSSPSLRLLHRACAEQLSPPKPLSESAQAFLLNVAPYLAVALVYAATQYARWLKVRAAEGA